MLNAVIELRVQGHVFARQRRERRPQLRDLLLRKTRYNWLRAAEVVQTAQAS